MAKTKEQYPPGAIHDIATGAIEGGIGAPLLEPVLGRLSGEEFKNPFRTGLAGRVASGAAIGAVSTGLIGALVSLAGRKRQEAKAREMSNPHVSDKIVEFSKFYVVDEDDSGNEAVFKIPGDSKAKAALKGGVIGGAAGIGAGVGTAAALPYVGSKIGITRKAVDRFEKALGGKSGARVKTSLALAGVVGKIGATVGAIEGVSKHNAATERSRAISRAIRKAREQGRTEQMSAVDQVIEFADEDYFSPRLRSGVRVDKYRKTIQAREIDRKISNTVKAAGLGAVAGIALPLKHKFTTRAGLGAAAGAGLAGALTLGSQKDQYGEQSEGAKLLQKRAIQGAGIAGLLTAAIKRRNQVGDFAKTVKAKFVRP